MSLTANYVSPSNSNETLTARHFYGLLMNHPQRLGIVAKMKNENTLTFLTEGIKNVIYRDEKPSDKYSSIDARSFEWGIEVDYLKRIEFVEVPVVAAPGEEITMMFNEGYFQKDEVFVIEKTRQQCIVVERPIRISDRCWKHVVRLLDNDYSTVLDDSGCQIGDTCRYLSAYKSELHDEGYTKYHSNVEKYNGYISLHRVDVSYSSEYAMQEDTFMKIAQGQDDNTPENEVMFKMDGVEKQCLDHFMLTRNNGLTFVKGNVQANGRPTIADKKTNRDIMIGDAALPQIEKYANKYYYANHLTVDAIMTAMNSMAEKSLEALGNTYLFMVNQAMWNDIQTTLYDWYKDLKSCEALMWSKDVDDYITLGATFNGVEFGGNKIIFKLDRSLTLEYGRKGFGVMIDVTPDESKGRPAIEMFTLKGKDFCSNQVYGVGGKDGKSSGPVSTTLSASVLINWGYSGIAVYCPFRSFMFYQI